MRMGIHSELDICIKITVSTGYNIQIWTLKNQNSYKIVFRHHQEFALTEFTRSSVLMYMQKANAFTRNLMMMVVMMMIARILKVYLVPPRNEAATHVGHDMPPYTHHA